MKTTRNILIALFILIQAFQLAGDDSYNCHNYAWESSRRWLDDPTPYIEKATECSPCDATHVVYYDDGKPIHSGLYYGWGFAKSKWGKNAVLVHPVRLTTYGTDIKYYNAGV